MSVLQDEYLGYVNNVLLYYGKFKCNFKGCLKRFSMRNMFLCCLYYLCSLCAGTAEP